MVERRDCRGGPDGIPAAVDFLVLRQPSFLDAGEDQAVLLEEGGQELHAAGHGQADLAGFVLRTRVCGHDGGGGESAGQRLEVWGAAATLPPCAAWPGQEGTDAAPGLRARRRPRRRPSCAPWAGGSKAGASARRKLGPGSSSYSAQFQASQQQPAAATKDSSLGRLPAEDGSILSQITRGWFHLVSCNHRGGSHTAEPGSARRSLQP